MPTTPTYALPYPIPSDPADVPADLQALAAATDGAITTALSTLPPSVSPPVWGGVYADATAWFTGSADWTASHVSPGRISVTFNTPMATIPAVTIAPAVTATMAFGLLIVGTAGFDVAFYDLTVSAYADCAFTFTASDFQ